jgi:hypothetical protein
LLGCSSSLLAEPESALNDVLDIEGASAVSERRSTPMEGHMCRWAMAESQVLPSTLSPVSSTFRDGHVLAGIFIRDPRAGPFTRSDTPQSTTFISEALLIAQASTATCFVVPSTVLKKLFASTPSRLPPSHHTSATSPQQCTTIRSRHFLTVAHARFFWNLLDQVGSRKTPHLSPSNPNNTIIMLRRPATTIQLTVADVEQYEANRQRKLWEQQQTQQQDSSQSTIASENAQEQIQSNPLKSRKERIMGGNGRGN